MAQANQTKSVSDAHRSKEDSSNDISARALAKAVIYLIEDLNWSRSEFAKILHLKPRTVNAWLQEGKIPIDRSAPSPEIQAIVHLIAIHRSLSSMFEDPRLKNEWINTEHPDFNSSPKSVMSKSIDGLMDVRRYLDYVRGRGA